jgi:methionyl-tRNA formyltransferase
MTAPLHLVYCGTPRFAVPPLEALIGAGFRISLVVTQPDKPRGRGLALAPSPVKQRALESGLPVAQPEKIKQNEDFRDQLAALRPDAIIVVGYGRILPQWMIDLPPLGNINVHASLLPKYRGAAPIQWAIAHGETLTGVTTMRIDAGLDTGDILQQREVAITPADTAETLAPRLAAAGASLLVETLRSLAAGSIHPQPQEHARATLAPILAKEDGRMDFQRTALELQNRWRGFQPWPGAYTTFRGKQLQVCAARVSDQAATAGPGVMSAAAEGLLVACSQRTALELLEVQPEGKKRMAARDFINGYRPQPGEKLGS